MRYISDNVISFSIKVKGREDSVRVNFLPLSAGGSSYSTDAPSVVEAMEKSPMYGKVYRRAPECLNESVHAKKPARVQRKKLNVVGSVSTWQDAIEYLTDNYSVDRTKIATPDDVLKEADNLGLSFPNLNS